MVRLASVKLPCFRLCTVGTSTRLSSPPLLPSLVLLPLTTSLVVTSNKRQRKRQRPRRKVKGVFYWKCDIAIRPTQSGREIQKFMSAIIFSAPNSCKQLALVPVSRSPVLTQGSSRSAAKLRLDSAGPWADLGFHSSIVSMWPRVIITIIIISSSVT